jgi:hypothetical protein
VSVVAASFRACEADRGIQGILFVNIGPECQRALLALNKPIDSKLGNPPQPNVVDMMTGL